MRLFIAIELINEIRDALVTFLREMREVAPHAKWVRGENLHVTLKFLGETDSVKLSAAQKALASIHSDKPVELNFRGVGFFPNERRPRVFWVGMEASANLKTLAEAINQEMHGLGFPLENRLFTPHLTLARFEPPRISPQLSAAAKENSTRSFGSLTAREFHLVESKLKRSGAEYTIIQSFPLLSGI